MNQLNPLLPCSRLVTVFPILSSLLSKCARIIESQAALLSEATKNCRACFIVSGTSEVNTRSGTLCKSDSGVGKVRNAALNPTKLAEELESQLAPAQAKIFLTDMMNPSLAPRIANLKTMPNNMKKAIEFLTLAGTVAKENDLSEELPANYRIK